MELHIRGRTKSTLFHNLDNFGGFFIILLIINIHTTFAARKNTHKHRKYYKNEKYTFLYLNPLLNAI